MTAIPNFADVPLSDGGRATLDDWHKVAGQSAEQQTWQTPEQISVKPLYPIAIAAQTAPSCEATHERA